MRNLVRVFTVRILGLARHKPPRRKLPTSRQAALLICVELFRGIAFEGWGSRAGVSGLVRVESIRDRAWEVVFA